MDMSNPTRIAVFICVCLPALYLYSFTVTPTVLDKQGTDSLLRIGQDLCSGLRRNSDLSKEKPIYPLKNNSVFFHRGYLDDRNSSLIRVLGMRRVGVDLEHIKCLWNTTTGDSVFLWEIKAKWQDIDAEWPTVNKYLAFMLVCDISTNDMDVIPQTIRLQEGDNFADILVRRPDLVLNQRQQVAVCVKPMTGVFDAARLVEWFEMQLLVGLKHIILYESDLRGVGRVILNYYKDLGIAKVVDFPFLVSMLQLAERDDELDSVLRYSLYQQIYLIAYQDCIYRFRSHFKYIMIIDMDEIILPVNKSDTIGDLLLTAEKFDINTASFVFYTSWHYEAFTKDPQTNWTSHMQRFAWGSPPTLDQPKSIINTDKTVSVNYHGVLTTMNNSNSPRFLLGWWDFASVHHFRSGLCEELFKKKCMIMSSHAKPFTAVTQYGQQSENAVRHVMRHLELF